jgi:D-glycero-D-manno-heptose 1,7-bisphosphate phosphatase
MNKAVFLDRDGTVIRDHGYLDNENDVELLDGAGDALQRLVKAEFKLILVTNQSGIGRGYFTPDIVEAQHQRLAELLIPRNVSFASIQICPHAPDADCDCRKPSPMLLKQAAAEHDIALSQSFMVGDKPSDVEAGRNAGCAASIMIKGRPDTANADYIAKNLSDAVDYILNN